MKKKSRTGEMHIAKNGMMMTIIAYRNSSDIDVQFEDGAVRENATFQQFRNGHIKHPSEKARILSRVGETAVANNTQIMIIVEYKNANDIVVEFNDEQHTRVKTTYKSFCKGNVKNPNFHTKETAIASNGMNITIKEYHNSKNVDVEFDDGTIAKRKTYQQFKSGQIRHPNEEKRLQNLKGSRVGRINTANNALKMKIITYRKYSDIDVEFEDETIRTGVSYRHFITGCIGHPTLHINGKGLLGTFETYGSFLTSRNQRYYRCKCKKCGFQGELTPQEMLAHICKTGGN